MRARAHVLASVHPCVCVCVCVLPIYQFSTVGSSPLNGLKIKIYEPNSSCEGCFCCCCANSYGVTRPTFVCCVGFCAEKKSLKFVPGRREKTKTPPHVCMSFVVHCIYKGLKRLGLCLGYLSWFNGMGWFRRNEMHAASNCLMGKQKEKIWWDCQEDFFLPLVLLAGNIWSTHKTEENNFKFLCLHSWEPTVASI